MTEITVSVVRLPHAEGLPLPAYATPGAAGLDLLAAVGDDFVIEAGTWAAVPTGLAIALPDGWEGQVRPRSGLALNRGVTVLNAPGTVDQDYRGEVKVILHNASSLPFHIDRGMRIAQLVVAPVTRLIWAEVGDVTALPASVRGTGGFGSTGV